MEGKTSGTLFGIPLQQNVDVNGRPLSGSTLSVFAAGTLTPANTYQDTALTILNPFPLTADASGRIPVFWVADGTYRARLSDANAVLIYDIDNILAIGPSSGGGGGGGGGTSSGFTTGDVIWIPIDGTRTNFVRLNGRTISSGSGAGTERANNDTSSLFGFLWNNFADGTCPVSGGRGGSATSDFNANKTIQLLSMRGRGAFGLDTMGNSAAGVITGGTTAFGTGGGQSQAIAQANLPSGVNLSAASLTGSVNTAISNGTLIVRSNAGGNFANNGTGANSQSPFNTANVTIALNDGTVTFGGTVPLGGSGTALPILSPYALGTWLISL